MQAIYRIPFVGIELPMVYAPFSSLALTQLLVRRASFLGHLAGILAGFTYSWVVRNSINAYWTFWLVVSCNAAAVGSN